MGGVIHKAKHAVGFMMGAPDQRPGSGSFVSNPNGPAQQFNPADQAAAEASQRQVWENQQAQQQKDADTNAAAWEARKGFLAPMMPTQSLPQPTGQWAYQASQGPVWVEPPGALPGAGPFRGNRM